MDVVGLRELRQNASEIVRRAEAGDTVAVTVSGREVAQLGPVQRGQWRAWRDIRHIFETPVDDEWQNDRDLIDPEPRDPFDV